uniref:Coatomer subunit zeta n=1 Tax=Pelagomonas calceolata TaxID=35677 RepID=A0A7S4A224_9STRA|mmetsp:Transcript_7647/g.21456  ORF Transcript_7647/g.21456 Transcript_7647/m.21456 type:complete len:112 (+) Transcript_7647:60-395(+)
MAISCLFLTDAKGKVIIGRNYRGDIPTSTSERFAQYIQDKDEMDQRPIFTEGGCTFAYIKHNNLFLTCVTRKNSNVALALMTLYRLISVRPTLLSIEKILTIRFSRTTLVG